MLKITVLVPFSMHSLLPIKPDETVLLSQKISEKYILLESHAKVTGATVHFVDGGTDTGPIILQKAVEVKEDDTPEALQSDTKRERLF